MRVVSILQQKQKRITTNYSFNSFKKCKWFAFPCQQAISWLCSVYVCMICTVVINVLYSMLHYEQSFNMFSQKYGNITFHNMCSPLFTCPTNSHAFVVQIKFYFQSLVISSQYQANLSHLLPKAHAWFHSIIALNLYKTLFNDSP